MMLLSALTFQSCDNDNDTDWDRVFPNALVTVKKSGDACYLQLDDNTTLLAKNLKPTIFDGKEGSRPGQLHADLGEEREV